MAELNCDIQIMDDDFFLVERAYRSVREQVEEFFDENVETDLYRLMEEQDKDIDLEDLYSSIHQAHSLIQDIAHLISKGRMDNE